ncbi:MAG: FGGY-family carbohydrate kinase [Chloroflexi bacterium]|nr:FGGY-family carbohydrate kinase [Chloroflexota bacterium]
MPDTNNGSNYLLCVDLGSSSIKTAVCTPSGNIVGSAHMLSAYVTSDLDGDLGVRYDATEMLHRVVTCSANSMMAAGISPDQIAGCSITSQRQGLAVLDEHLSPLLISPNRDLRAIFQGAAIDERIGDLVWDETAHLPSYLGAWAKLQWLAEEEPELMKRAAYAVTLSDWLVAAMTGKPTLDASNGVESGLVNVDSGKYSSALANQFPFGINDSLRVTVSGAVSGGLTEKFASVLGITPGTPVINCGPDTQVALAGLDTTLPGDTAIVAGWSCVVQSVTDSLVRDAERRMWNGRHVLPDRWVLESNVSVTGGAYQWLIELLYGDGSPANRMDEIDTLLADAGSQITRSSVHLVPPTVDISNPGLQFGGIGFPIPLALDTPDRIDVIRASLHGFGFAIKANLARLDETVNRSDSILAIGGGMTRTSYFTSALSTILDEPLRIGPPDASLVGAARLAANALGLEPDTPDDQFKIIEPDQTLVSDFNYLYSEWLGRSQRLSEIPI